MIIGMAGTPQRAVPASSVPRALAPGTPPTRTRSSLTSVWWVASGYVESIPPACLQTNVTAAGECLIDTTQPECASAWCDENRVERDVDYDGPLAPVTGSWSADVPDAQVTSSPNVVLCLFSCTGV